MRNKEFEDFIKNKTSIVGYYNIEEFKDADLVVTIVGDGMKEKYCSGDRIALKILESVDDIIFGFDYSIWLSGSDESVLVRQILQSDDKDCILLHAYNPIREDMVFPKEKILYVGKIIGLIRTNL